MNLYTENKCIYAAYFTREKCVICYECSGFFLYYQTYAADSWKHIHEGILAFRALLPSLYPEGVKDIPVQLYDSWLDCRDKRVQINLHPSKWVSVTVEIKRFWLASQMTDVLVPFPPQWPADKPGLERDTVRLLHTHIHTFKQTCTRSHKKCTNPFLKGIEYPHKNKHIHLKIHANAHLYLCTFMSVAQLYSITKQINKTSELWFTLLAPRSQPSTLTNH